MTSPEDPTTGSGPLDRLLAFAASPTPEAWGAYRESLTLEDVGELRKHAARVDEALADLRAAGSRPGKYATAIRARLKVALMSKRPASPSPTWQPYVIEGVGADDEPGYDGPPALTPKGILASLGYDSPVPLAIPPGYTLDEDGRVWFRPDPDDRELAVEVLAEPVVIVASVMLADGDSVSLDLAWRYRGSWRRAVVDRRVVADARAIVALAGQGFPVTSTSASDVVRYLAGYEAANREWLPLSRASRSIGWVGSSSFLWGPVALGEPVRLHADEGTSSHARAYTDRGTLGGWMGMWTDTQPYPRVALAVYAALAPVVLGVVRDASGFVVDWAGRTSGGKSTALRLAASVWGAPALIQTWNTTAAGMERYAALHHCLPVITDDTQHARHDKERVANLIYLVTGTKGRLRASVDGLRASHELRTVLLSTGESPATSFTEEAGARARTLTLIGMPMGPDHPEARRASERIEVGTGEHFGHVGPAFVRWLLDHPDRWPGIVERWRALRETHARESGPAGRAANYLATLTVAAELAEESVGLVVRRAALDEARACADASVDGADRALSAVHDMLAWLGSLSGSVYVAGSQQSPPRECVAVVQSTGRLVVNPVSLRDWLRKQGHDPAGILTEWDRRGWTEHASTRAGGRSSPKFNGIRFTAACQPVSEAMDTVSGTLQHDGD